MTQDPAIVVIDEDGELDDVRAALEELGLEFASWAKEAIPPDGLDPRQLLVATAPAAAALGGRAKRRVPAAVWVGVTNTDSRTQRSLLLARGFDYLVRRPVHPIALQLLLRRALFRGQEQRRGPRVAVGYETTFRAGVFAKRATLVDLSLGACRVLVRQPLERGARVKIQIPGEIDGGKSIQLPAQVLRSRRGDFEGGEEREHSVVLRFLQMNGATRARLREIMRSLAAGPARLPEGTEPRERSKKKRQRASRRSYDGEVQVFGDADFVVVGRDLSRSGMRIEQHDGLAVGDNVRMAIAAAEREEPIVVGATVVRDDGEEGLALRFDELLDDGAERLDDLLSRRPVIEALTGEQEGGGLVLSRILPARMRTYLRSR